jgi:transcriptional regulator with XRE-family HTH domain
MTISQRIFRLLKAKGKMQKELAAYTGISTAAISDWKTHGTNPSSDKIVAIAEFLGTSPEYLLTGKESEKNLSENEIEVLHIYRKFSDRDQIKIIGRLEQMYENKRQNAVESMLRNKDVNYTDTTAKADTDESEPSGIDISTLRNAKDSSNEY